MTFEELNLSEPLLRAVAQAGYTQPSPIQGQAIPPVLEGRDLLGCAQTGTGKTAAFALPMLQRLAAMPARRAGAVRALILTPTRELALQIGESFSAYGKYLKLRHTVIFGGVGQQPQIDTLKKGVDILIACPGRLNDLVSQGHVDLSQVEIFVLDEADRMLDMGFIHDVRRVIRQLPDKAQRQTLLFSATMPKEIEQLAGDLLKQPVFVKVDPVSSTVDRIEQTLYFVEKANKKLLLPHLIKTLTPPVTNALVFSRTKYGADKIAKDLTKKGIPAAAIHGNKSQSARVTALEQFKQGKTRVLVATDIAARGIDISELAYVFNYDLPEVPETYVHRIGRTARAGAEGCAVSFCAPEEKEYLAGIEKLNRKKIPVVQGHPWDGVPAPERPVLPVRGKKPAKAEPAPAKTEISSAEKPLQKDRIEEDTMEENKTRQPAQGDKLSASAKRRRRRKPKGEPAAQQPAAEKNVQQARPGKARPQPAAKKQPRRERQPQPKFDPHFLSLEAADQAQGVAQPRGRAARPDRAAQGQQNKNAAPGRGQNAPARSKNTRPQPAARPEKQAPKAEKPRRERPAAPQRGRQRPVRDDNPGLELISRRPPQQKYANFEEYMEARGGVTAPVEDYAED